MVTYSVLFLTVIFLAYFSIGSNFFGFLEGASLDFGYIGLASVFKFFLAIAGINWILLFTKIPKIFLSVIMVIFIVIAIFSFYSSMSQIIENENFVKDKEKMPWGPTIDIKDLNINWYSWNCLSSIY